MRELKEYEEAAATSAKKGQRQGGVCEENSGKSEKAFFLSSRRRHTRYWRDWSSDVCSSDLILLAPILKFLIRLIPFVLTWFMFTGLYIFMPNTKVKFKHAFISGIVVGTAYQTFQFIYISGQLWVSKYNAIYGSFAALPLFLLWLQISWTICLFGAELTYAGQNVRNFSFDQETQNISRRYRDFISILDRKSVV